MAIGDHVYVYRKGYSHHGIEVEEGQVVHYESDAWRKLRGLLQPARSPVVRQVDKAEFAQGCDVRTRRYVDADPPEMVVDRARSRLGESVYHVMGNNCEHFAVWCKTGRHTSTQIEALREAVRPLGGTLATSAFLWRHARRLPTPARPWAYGTAIALTAGTFVARYLRFRWASYQRGES